MMSTPKRLRRASRQADLALNARRRRNRRLLVIGASAAAAVVLAVVLVVVGELGRDDKATSSAPVEARLYPGIPRDGRTLGNPDAAVTIDEWVDFQCPYCKEFSETVKSRLIQDFVATGAARIVFHDMAFIGQESVAAANAARCAADQGVFWEYEDALFKRQGAKENAGTFSREMLTALGQELGLNAGDFASCMDDDRHRDSILAERDLGNNRGIRTTPTIFVNGRLVENWPDYAGFRQLVESEIAAH